MSAERLREMLSEATPGPWFLMNGWGEKVVVRTTGLDVKPIPDSEADARLIALAPDAIALLADAADAIQDTLASGVPAASLDEILDRLDALCGDER